MSISYDHQEPVCIQRYVYKANSEFVERVKESILKRGKKREPMTQK